MKLITISGLDGSGKSTQIQLLKNYLESQGSKVFYFHAIKFSLAKKITDFIKKGTRCPIGHRVPKKTSEKSVAHANAFQIWLRKFFLRIDIWRFKRVSNKLLTSGYDCILSDRYFYDSVINIEFLCRKRIYAFPTRIIKPDTAIYLQTLPEIIMRRKRVPDQGIEYLKKKKELYDNKENVWNWRIIDGNRNKEEIFEEIKALCQI